MNFLARGVALAIDLVIFLVLFAAMHSLAHLVKLPLGPGALAILLSAVYFVGFQRSGLRATVGMMATKMKVHSDSSSKAPTVPKLVLRFLILFLPILLFVAIGFFRHGHNLAAYRDIWLEWRAGGAAHGGFNRGTAQASGEAKSMDGEIVVIVSLALALIIGSAVTLRHSRGKTLACLASKTYTRFD